MAKIIELISQEVQDKLTNKEINLIDIRELIERKEEYIKNSQLKSLSEFNEEIAPQEHDIQDNTPVYYCRSGNRTRQFAERLVSLGCTKDVYILKGGIISWKETNHKTAKSPIIKFSILQQANIIAGALVLLGAIFSVLINNNFIYLNILIGIGLLCSGISRNFSFENIVNTMPWNK